MDLVIAKEKAYGLLQKYKLNDWKIEYQSFVVKFGVCNEREQTIFLSKKLVSLNTEEIVIDTILHEIAHALVGCWRQHDDIWKAKAIEIGANPQELYDSTIVEFGLTKEKIINGKLYKRGDTIMVSGRYCIGEGIFWGFLSSNPKNNVYVKLDDNRSLVKCPMCSVIDYDKPKDGIPKSKIGDYLCQWCNSTTAFVGIKEDNGFRVLKLINTNPTWQLENIKGVILHRNISGSRISKAIQLNIADGDYTETFPYEKLR